MTVLGAIMTGGASSRFGADKALHVVKGRPLIDHIVATITAQTDALVLCGGHYGRLQVLEDRPAPNMGPLAGLNAALYYAHQNGFSHVLAVPVDVYPLPGTLMDLLSGNGPAVLADQHLVGLWPASLCAALDAFLKSGKRAVRGWNEHAGARLVDDPPGLININRIEDLKAL
jgi:molybdenum cofactor guanylyltransferase